MPDAPDEAGVGKYYAPIENEPDFDFDDTIGVVDPSLESSVVAAMHGSESDATTWMATAPSHYSGTEHVPAESVGSGFTTHEQSLAGDTATGGDGLSHV